MNWSVLAQSPLNVVGTAPLSVLFCTPGRLGAAVAAGIGTVPPGSPPAGGPPPPGGPAGGPPPVGCPGGAPPPGGPDRPPPWGGAVVTCNRPVVPCGIVLTFAIVVVLMMLAS
jgi:hypothetical protein